MSWPLIRSRRAWLLTLGFLLFVAIPFSFLKWMGHSFPPDTTPEGAYLRIVLAVTDHRVDQAFAYLETEAQWASYSIFEYRRKTATLLHDRYAEPERSRLLSAYASAVASRDAPDWFGREALTNGWVHRLRKDLSGIAKVEIQRDRATVETVRGTRYPFRKRENGIWGLTLFTSDLRTEAEKAARDFSLIEKAATDYQTNTAP